jgi:hypothetical protein
MSHPLFTLLGDRPALARFMETHAFAVYGGMSLVKRLQHELTTVTVPWTPPHCRHAARFVNELVMLEESGLDDRGLPRSHYELYLEAMAAIGADTAPAMQFVREIDDGSPYALEVAFARARPPALARDVVRAMLHVARQGTLGAVLGRYLASRETVAPAGLITALAAHGTTAPALADLARHARRVGGDADGVGGLAGHALIELSSRFPQFEAERLRAAHEAAAERLRLWDGLHAALATPTDVPDRFETELRPC